MIWTFLFSLGFCCVFTGMALAQVDQGAINGVVKDTAGAVVPYALVTLTNTDTNFALQGKTDARGQYSFSPIKIGHYTLSATAPKFATTTQENITVNIQDVLNIGLTLRPGGVTENVTVTTAPPMLQSENASVGQVVDTETINNTPLNGRNWVYIAQFTAGVAPGIAAGGAPGAGTGDFSANGQRTLQNNFILDGVDNNNDTDSMQNGQSYNVRPPPDALAEFKLDTSNYSAEFGHSAGAVLNASIKSGTNHIHGDLWEYVRNNRLDAADWDSAPNASGGINVPAYHENQFGATLGLPIFKNKLFYFGDAQANRIAFSEPIPGLNVPTASERNGDFSEFFNPVINGQGLGGGPIGVFAPNTAGQVPMTQAGGAFPNPDPTCATHGSSICSWNSATPGVGNGTPTTNVLTPGNPYNTTGAVPVGMMDPIAGELLNDYPKPNSGGWTSANYGTPGSGNLYQNYSINDPIKDTTFQWDQRLDWNISAKDQTYMRYSYSNEHIGSVPPLGNIIDGSDEAPAGVYQGHTVYNLAQNFMASETHLFSPSVINEFRFGYNWGLSVISQLNANTDAETLVPGLGGVPFSGPGTGGLPQLRLYSQASRATAISEGGAAYGTPSTQRQDVYQILDNLTKIHGSHSLKFGFQFESIRPALAASVLPRGYYNFDGVYSGKYNSGGGHAPLTGLGAADAFSDNAGNMEMSPNWTTEYYRDYRAGYAQDDWRFNSKLTVNLGVRYDFIQPYSSKDGALANYVITSESVLPGGAVNGTYVTGTGTYIMPAIAANAFPVGAGFLATLAGNNSTLQYTSTNQNSLTGVQHYNFAPRIGLAYSINPKTVVRAAYGIFYGAIESPGAAELETNFPFAYNTVMYNPYLGNYGECFPSTNTGYNNNTSGCPSNGSADLAESNAANPNYNYTTTNPGGQGAPVAIGGSVGTTPGTTPSAGYGIPAGWNPFPHSTTLETGASGYLTNGVVNPANASGEATALAMSDPNVKTPYTQSYNLTVEREITKNMVATVGYVGNNAKHTYAGTTPMSPLVMTNPNDPTDVYAFPGLGVYAHDQQWIGESMYNSLQAKLEQRLSYGLSFLASYTWSHAMDDAGNPGIGVGPPFRNSNLIPLKDEFTNANYDIRHRFTFNGAYDLPFGKGRRYMNQGGVFDYLVGGWSTSATWTAQTGIPFTVTTGSVFVPAGGFNQINAIKVSNPFAGGGTPPVANVDMAGLTCPAKVHNRQNWFNPCAFVDPAPGAEIAFGPGITPPYDLADAIKYSGSKSAQLHGPGWERVNMSLFKNFKTWRSEYVQFRADAFNLFNTPSNGQPSSPSLGSTAGLITNTQAFQNYTPDSRFFQLSGKYVF
jgi:hypothetical protein